MITTLYIKGQNGLTYVQLPELSYVKIITVTMSGKTLTEVSGSPVGIEFKYDMAAGKIIFDIDLPFPNAPDYVPVFIKYTT